MSATGAGYDYSVMTYSPDGRVFQVEYAYKAVEKSGTCIGIKCKDGVVLGVEKLIPQKMLMRHSNRRIHTVDKHVGMALAGLAADARQIVNEARSECVSYKSNYGDEIPATILHSRISQHIHMCTLSWAYRPYGCSALVASYDEDEGPQLFMIEPNGVGLKYYATALGKHTRSAKTELEKINFDTITCREAVKEIARIIVKLHDDIKDKDYELELSWVCDESNRKHVRIPEELRVSTFKEAKEAKERAEMESDSDSD